MFELEDLIYDIHEKLADAGVLNDSTPLKSQTTAERRVWEQIDEEIVLYLESIGGP